MIKLLIQTDGKDIVDSFTEDRPTLQECSLIIYRMKEIEQYLLSKDFESKFEVKDGDFVDED